MGLVGNRVAIGLLGFLPRCSLFSELPIRATHKSNALAEAWRGEKEVRNMKTMIVSFGVLVLLVLPAAGQDKEEERVANAGTVISEIMNIPDNVSQDTIALAFSGRPLSDTKHCASGFGRALRPRNGKQECTLFQRFDVMHHATVQDQQLSSRQVDLL